MAKYKLDQWKDIIAEWQKSGKTRKEYCHERDVTVATFSYWRTKINKLKRVHSEQSGNEGFVQYRMPSSLSTGYSIEWPDGMKLRFPTGIGVQELTSLLVSLRSL